MKIPPGVDNGSRVRIAGQGAPGRSGGPPGDLYLVTLVRPDPRFERHGDELRTRVTAPFPTLLLGGEVRVPTPDGRSLALRIPAGTQDGRVFRLRGIPSSAWQELLKKHPPREDDEQDQQAEFNRKTFPVAAVAACCAMPKMTVAQAEKLVDEKLTDGQWNTLFAHVWNMHTTAVDIPFSLAASALLAGSEPKPK